MADDVMQRKREIMAWVVWGAITASIALYAAVAFVALQGVPAHSPIDPIIEQALVAASVAMAAASFAVARFLLPRSGAPFSPESPVRSVAFGRWFAILVVRLALHEAVAIFGLVLAFLSGDAERMLPFAAAAAILNLFALPRHPPRET